MKHYSARFIALCLLVSLLAGCGGGETPSGADTTTAAEQEVTTQSVEEILGFAKEDNGGKTFTIHNFIERLEKPSQVENKEPYILFMGRLSKEKGIELLAETARALPEYPFVIAGSGPDDACLKGISNVELKGFLLGEELLQLMANAKLLIVPSVWYENCPLSILEAQSMGVPIVTMNSGGMAELVEDGKTGGLIKEPTVEGVAEVIKRCWEDSHYEMLKTTCEQHSETIMSVTDYCQILVKEYENLISKR